MTECSRRPLGESLTRLLRDRGKALARTEFRRGWNEPIDLRLLFTNNSAISTIFRRGARLLVIRKSDESMYIFLSCCSCYVGWLFFQVISLIILRVDHDLPVAFDFDPCFPLRFETSLRLVPPSSAMLFLPFDRIDSSLLPRLEICGGRKGKTSS